jgi:hypothetical protein
MRSLCTVAAIVIVEGALATAQGILEELSAPDARANDLFGSAVAIDGARVLVGAPLRDDACAGDYDCQSGAAYLFDRDTLAASSTVVLHASDARPLDGFGHSVALAGGVAVVGAGRSTDWEGLLGTAYVFEEEQGSWRETARLHASGQAPEDGFAEVLATDGAHIAVGSPDDDVFGYPDAGTVTIFERVDGIWRETGRLSAPVPDPKMRFGSALALEGKLLLVGAPGDAHAGDSSGSVFVFREQHGVWELETRLSASDADWYDSFGAALALDGDRAGIGAPGADESGSDSGLVYVFERRDGAWQEQAKLEPHAAHEGLRFGWSVGLAGRTLVAGTPMDGANGNASGAIWAFREAREGWNEIAVLRPRDGEAVDFLGPALAFDAGHGIAGATGVDRGESPSVGAAYLFQIPAFATPCCDCASAAPCENYGDAAGCANSTGKGASLSITGTNELDPLGFELVAADLPPGAFCVLFLGPPGAPLPFGDGWRCIERTRGAFLRLATATARHDGRLVLGPEDLASLPRIVVPGTEWAVQLAFSDPSGPCGGGMGSTNAIVIDF